MPINPVSREQKPALLFMTVLFCLLLTQHLQIIPRMISHLSAEIIESLISRHVSAVRRAQKNGNTSSLFCLRPLYFPLLLMASPFSWPAKHAAYEHPTTSNHSPERDNSFTVANKSLIYSILVWGFLSGGEVIFSPTHSSSHQPPLITTSQSIFAFSSKATDINSITHVMTFKDLFKSCHMEADKDTAL